MANNKQFLCPEVCPECRDGKHLYHYTGELDDITIVSGSKFNPFLISGYYNYPELMIDALDNLKEWLKKEYKKEMGYDLKERK